MEKKLLFLLLFAAAALMPVNALYGYLSDYAEVKNPATVGYQETTITEEFPPVTPVLPEEDPTYPKTAWVSNPAAANNANCDAYVRMRISFSHSDIAQAVTLEGLSSSGWIWGDDGYYYYPEILREGENTPPLFQAVHVSGDQLTEAAEKYLADFRLVLYEESVQAKGFSSYREAWDFFLRRRAA